MQIFEPQNKNGKNSKKNPEVHSYLLKPVTGNARYIKLPSNESRIPEKPLQKAIVYLDDVTLCLSKVYFLCLSFYLLLNLIIDSNDVPGL